MAQIPVLAQRAQRWSLLHIFELALERMREMWAQEVHRRTDRIPMSGGRHRKLPSREEIVRLYLEEGLGTPQIAKMFGLSDPHGVRVQLLRAGVQLRRHTIRTKCVECGKPVVKVKHNKFGLYGKRCKEHQKLHRKKVCASWSKKFRAENPVLVKERYQLWINKLRAMSPDQLMKEIEEKPCQFKKDELLRKIRKLSRRGKFKEAIAMVKKAFPIILPKPESQDQII